MLIGLPTGREVGTEELISTYYTPYKIVSNPAVTAFFATQLRTSCSMDNPKCAIALRTTRSGLVGRLSIISTRVSYKSQPGKCVHSEVVTGPVGHTLRKVEF